MALSRSAHGGRKVATLWARGDARRVGPHRVRAVGCRFREFEHFRDCNQRLLGLAPQDPPRAPEPTAGDPMTPNYAAMWTDIGRGLMAVSMWSRLGWRDARLRYRRTVIGPFWTTLSLGLFIVMLGIIWSHLWKQDPKIYIPFVSSGMIAWAMLSTITSEGTSVFVAAQTLIRELPTSYTMLACALVWRNLIAFGHNVIIYVAVCFYAGVQMSWSMLLIVPGLVLMCLNGIWIALVLGLACVRFRDIQQLVTTILQVALFVTPIFWSPQQLSGSLSTFEQYNILFHYVSIVRDPLLGQTPTLGSWLMVTVATVLGWGLTLVLYSRFRRRIPYWL
jgi:ABC-type polysaccharide/polyol phosphate export permease